MEVIAYEPVKELPPRRIARAFLWPARLLGLSLAVGFVTNWVNGQVSLNYFRWIIGASTEVDVLLQGLLEGFGTSLVLSVVLVPVYCGVTGCRMPLNRLNCPLMIAALLAFACYLLRGISGWLWGRMSPAGFTAVVPVAKRTDDIPAFAYVGAAIWGAYAGAFLALIWLCIAIPRAWLRYVDEPQP